MSISGTISTTISILCVEDEEGSRDILNSSLAMKYPGATLYAAANGAEGLALYKEHLPDIVVTDISMPVMDGLQMAAIIKSLNPDVIIIAVTAISDTEYLLNAIEIGIHRYVLKPLDFMKLFEIIDQHTKTIIMKRQLKNQEERNAELNAELAARAAELERANQDLDAFNYTVAHDLRSPVTGIAGFCNIILEKYGHTFDDNCGKFFSIIQKETLRMDQLINTLLDFARFSRQKMKLEKVDLSQIALLISLELKVQNPERQAEFIIADKINCCGDAGLLQVVMNNLLGNAWKYSMKQEKSIIEFGLIRGNDQLPTCYVRDNGVGFDKNLADKLFDPFQRLHSDDEFSGHGIGLATVQRIIQRHDGRVWAESELGKGATFYFTFKGVD